MGRKLRGGMECHRKEKQPEVNNGNGSNRNGKPDKVHALDRRKNPLIAVDPVGPRTIDQPAQKTVNHYFGGSGVAGNFSGSGAPVPGEPRNILRPSVKAIFRALTRFSQCSRAW